MHDNDLELEVIARWREGRSQRSIARELNLCRKRVRRIIERHQLDRREGSLPPQLRPKPRRASQLDAFQEKIDSLLARYPDITAVRMFEELRKDGYQGGYSILRDRLRQLRPRPKQQPVVRFETSPGAQAQMDYAVYDLEFAHEGRRRVCLFSYILGYSRRQYIHFTESQDFETTIREHVRAFQHLQGAASVCLYDNMKVVVQRWEHDHPVYNTRFLAFAAHYGFRPSACRPRRPQTKGKVERPFAYIQGNLLNGRTFRSLEHLNETARWWLANVADVRKHRTTSKTPLELHAEEVPHLLPRPAHDYDTSKVVYRLASPEGFVAYAQNQYSVPWRLAPALLPVRVTEDRLQIYDQHLSLAADHPLLPSHVSGQQQIDPQHLPPRSQRVKTQWLRERFAQWGEIASQFLEGLLAKQRYARSQAQAMLAWERHYRRQDLLVALERAVRYHAYSYQAVERILAAQASPQPGWKHLSEEDQELLKQLPNDPTVRPSREYQHLLFEEPPDDPQEDQPEDQRQRPDSQPDPGASPDAESSAD
jgi:transposase